jgi:hypothetical protein
MVDMGEMYSYMGLVRNAYIVLVRKPQGKKPLRRPGHGQEDNIKIGPRSRV